MPDIIEIAKKQMQDSICKNLQSVNERQIKCYLNRREWQLEQFQIGYTPDWSREELIFVLRQKLKTIRKMKRCGVFGRLRTLAPMFHVALEAEIALAQEAA